MNEAKSALSCVGRIVCGRGGIELPELGMLLEELVMHLANPGTSLIGRGRGVPDNQPYSVQPTIFCSSV